MICLNNLSMNLLIGGLVDGWIDEWRVILVGRTPARVQRQATAIIPIGLYTLLRPWPGPNQNKFDCKLIEDQ